MKVILRSVVLPLVLFSFLGCRERVEQSGNLTEFVVKKFRAYGAHVTQTKELPLVTAEWSSQQDANGFQIVVKGDRFKEVDDLFAKLGGSPVLTDVVDAQGFPRRVYKLGETGLTSLYHKTANGVEIICVKNISQWK